MNSTYNKSYKEKSFLSTQNIILASLSLGILAVLYFLLFSAEIPTPEGLRRPVWYRIGTYIFEISAFLFASYLCFKNWSSRKIVIGRHVWLTIGIGMLSYALGDIFFGYHEIILKKEPIISTGDIFFVITYLSVGLGMILTVVSRKINLEVWQWIIVLSIGIVGSVFAWVISSTINNQDSGLAQLSPLLQRMYYFVNWFYVVSDVLLVMIATTVLFAFWGGKLAMSWRMIAIASFFLYIADMWFKYASSSNPDYQSGHLLEVFWVLSAVSFGMGAAFEYDASLSRSRRERGGRKRV
ncbi:MAG: hypothetical protein AAF378_03000 [Cyanobacteria bacterium P01_A01_bin.84]